MAQVQVVMAALATSLGPASVGATFGAVAAVAIRAIVQAFKISKDADGSLDALQAKRIAELERRMDENDRDCHAKLEAMNSRLIVVAQVTIEVTAELRVHAPTSTSLERARMALQTAFPVDFNTPTSLRAKAEQIDRLNQGGKP